MSIADKLVTVAENQQKVYDAGKTAEWNVFWDVYQDNGNRTGYAYAFASNGWEDITFRPKYNIRIVGNGERCFGGNYITNLAERLEEMGVTLDTSGATKLPYAFYGGRCTRYPTISLVGLTDKSDGLLGWASYLVTVDKLILKEDGTTPISAGWFNSTSNLENITIEGVIGQNSLNVGYCPKLTHDSLMSIINALQDKTSDTSGTSWSVTLGDANKNKLTTEELNIALNKGWTVK